MAQQQSGGEQLKVERPDARSSTTSDELRGWGKPLDLRMPQRPRPSTGEKSRITWTQNRGARSTEELSFFLQGGLMERGILFKELPPPKRAAA